MTAPLQRGRLLRCAVCVLFVLLTLAAAAPLPHIGGSEALCTWMTQLADDTPLTHLSIPGTHNSGALHSIADVSGKCQTLSITDQLSIGVRFFDIRLRLVGDSLCIVHDFVDQKQTFDTVLADLIAFLDAHPGEVLFVSLKQDDAPKNASRPFAQVLQDLLHSHTDRIRPDRTLPETLGAARGGIYLLSRYENAAIGLDCYHRWADNATFFSIDGLFVQDAYAPPSHAFKQEEILAALAIAGDGGDRLTLNFASCYYADSFPPIYAGIPAKTVNPWLLDLLADRTAPVGVLLCDFMTAPLARAIIEVNCR